MSHPPTRQLLRTIEVLSLFELASVAVLLINLATAHSEPITSTIGPVHGAFYLSVAVTVLFGRGLRPRTRLLPLIPALGGAFALWCTRAERRRLSSQAGRTVN